MIQIRKSGQRGFADHGWLKSRHTFSFGGYYDPQFMGWGDLRVINEDVVQPSQGFGRHPHRDMEILSYVVEGELAHKDSMGTVAVLRPGDVQRMSAGTGVTHSEFNHSRERPVHFLQIWIVPNETGVKPRYSDRHFSRDQKLNRSCLIASPDGRDGSFEIQQDACLSASILEAGKRISPSVIPTRKQWIQVIRGTLLINGLQLAQGDAAACSGLNAVEMIAQDEAEFLWFDLR